MMDMHIESATAMLKCLQTFGERTSNPVLEVLGQEVPVNERHYPAENLAFGTARWRAFYHCHATPDNTADEHGHFHLFANVAGNTETPRWAHVAGLSMSRQGQPQNWFTVNQWVTGGDWLPTGQLPALLAQLEDEHEPASVGHWLSLMLRLYQADLHTLYQQRDRHIAQACHTVTTDDFLKDRSIYTLAALGIDLEQRLVSAFSHTTTQPAGRDDTDQTAAGGIEL